MSCTASVNFSIAPHDVQSAGLNPAVDVGQTDATSPAIQYTNGTATAQYNVLYQAPLTFSGTTLVLNLVSGLLDGHGNAIDAARIKFYKITNTSLTNSMTVGGGTNPVGLFSTGAETIPVGATIAGATPDATGWLVTPSTGMNLNFVGTSGQSFTVTLGLANS